MTRSVHHTLWLVNEIALASGDTCIVTGSNRAADEVSRIQMGTKHNPHAFFRVVVPGISGSGRGFARILIDESFDAKKIRDYFEWYSNHVFSRLIPSGEVRACLC